MVLITGFEKYIEETGILTKDQLLKFEFFYKNFAMIVKKSSTNTQDSDEKRKIVSALSVFLKENSNENNFYESLANRIMTQYNTKCLIDKLKSTHSIFKILSNIQQNNISSIFIKLLKQTKKSKKTRDAKLKNKCKQNPKLNLTTNLDIISSLKILPSLPDLIDSPNNKFSRKSSKSKISNNKKFNKLDPSKSIERSRISSYIESIKKSNNSIKPEKKLSPVFAKIRKMNPCDSFMTRQKTHSKNKNNRLYILKKTEEVQNLIECPFKPKLIKSKYDGYDFKTINNLENLNYSSYCNVIEENSLKGSKGISIGTAETKANTKDKEQKTLDLSNSNLSITNQQIERIRSGLLSDYKFGANKEPKDKDKLLSQLRKDHSTVYKKIN